jgi:hypothetical protein
MTERPRPHTTPYCNGVLQFMITPGAIGVNGATHLTREFIPSERPLIPKTGKSLARENFLIKILINLTDIACWFYCLRRDL